MSERPPLPLNSSVKMLRDDLNLAGGGEYLRRCVDVVHVYETMPGWCQCGERWWGGGEHIVQRRFWHRWHEPRISNTGQSQGYGTP